MYITDNDTRSYSFRLSPCHFVDHNYMNYVDDGEDIDFDVDFLPLLDLTTFPGVTELEKNQADATSEAIIIPDGLIFGNKIATLAYVSYYHARLLTCKVPLSNYIYSSSGNLPFFHIS